MNAPLILTFKDPQERDILTLIRAARRAMIQSNVFININLEDFPELGKPRPDKFSVQIYSTLSSPSIKQKDINTVIREISDSTGAVFVKIEELI